MNQSRLAMACLIIAVFLVAVFILRDFIAPTGFLITNPTQTIEIEPEAAEAVVEFLVKSRGKSTTVTSVDASCDCVCFKDFPVAVPASGERAITATIDLSRIKLPSERMFKFYLDPPSGQHVAIVNLVPQKRGS